ncbi:MAG: amidase [Myxococcota bacterium]|jgi:amidase
MTFPEYDSLDATGLADLVRCGEVSAGEVLDAAIERLDARNPQLNAVVHPLLDRARERVETLPDGPLRGVPFLLKDLKLQLRGTPTTNATRLMRRHLATHNSLLAERYEDAGLQILGKSNSPEAGIMGITEPELYGPTRNPWSTDHTPGGSSGGTSAAVAARIVPAGHAGDGGGSIRIPASHTGTFGLKPTRGRVSMAPFLGESWSGFVQEHAITRSVRDSALLLDIEGQPTLGEPYAAPPQERPWREEVGRDPGRLRLAYSADTLFAGETHLDCRAALNDSVRLLAGLGHEVEEARPPFPRDELVRAYFIVVAAGVARFVDDVAEWADKKPRSEDFEPATWILALIGWKSSAADLVWAQQSIQRAARPIAAFFQKYDGFVTPTTARPAARIGELALQPMERLQIKALSTVPIKALLDLALSRMGAGKLAWTPNTQLFNQTGQPAMSVPLYWNGAGIPIGTQIVAPFGGEAMLFRLAAQLESERPWTGRLPPGITA